MGLRELQDTVTEVRAGRGFTTDPVRILVLLTEEVGELAREVKRTWSPNYGPPRKAKLGEELADAFVCLCALADAFDVDLESEIHAKFLVQDGRRKWASAEGAGPDGAEPRPEERTR